MEVISSIETITDSRVGIFPPQEAIDERLKLTLAHIQAACAQVTSKNGSHGVQVKVFYLLSGLAHCITVVEGESLKLIQPGVEKALLEMVSGAFGGYLTSPFHNLLQHCFMLLFSKGDTRNVLDVAHVLQNRIALKTGDSNARNAAIACLSALFKTNGRILLGYLNETVTIIYKQVIKSSSSTAYQRYLAVMCVVQASKSCGYSGKSSHHIVMKVLNKCLIDKSVMVREVAFSALYEVALETNYFESVQLDVFIENSRKGLTDGSLSVRSASSSALGRILSLCCGKYDNLDKESETTLDSPGIDPDEPEKIDPIPEESPAGDASAPTKSLGVSDNS
eukprot:CAMPEP_0184007902 /NCGR_PEP_ID=MMETSP0954-20121128/1632_1 /TAXON_ID=627963 /ORGANISM="Aplanochytrium sp, Strain PBS07" /LENGTH=335 /DNA_ID=CAMNT_0026286865 /DNA_START=101 /DNA_END=1105 /DNA_ORIENTATION=+